MADSDNVRIREVGPRDGFQNEPEVIPTDDKVRLIDMLARSGLRRLEATSFVRPDVIPQLADAREVLERIDPPGDVSISVLIPNEKGLENALQLRDRFLEVNLFLSASETHNRRNVNRSVEESLAGIERVIARAGDAGLRCEGVISVSFGCPYEGHVPPERVFAIAERLAAAGCEEVAFGDTTGMANPAQVGEFFRAARERLPGVELAAHAPHPGLAAEREQDAVERGRVFHVCGQAHARLVHAARERPADACARAGVQLGHADHQPRAARSGHLGAHGAADAEWPAQAD